MTRAGPVVSSGRCLMTGQPALEGANQARVRMMSGVLT